MPPVDVAAIERKWQERWRAARIFEPKLDPHRRKFFIIFAYPGMSGFLHVGHMRSYSYPDVIARYMRMRGFNVLFPAGFHASGLPAVGFAKRVVRGEFEEYLRDHGVDAETAKRLEDPKFVVAYFVDQYWKEWERFGISLDRRSSCTTIDPGYNRFIQWQIRRLNDKKLLVTKPHFAPYCPTCGPVAVDAAETDLLRGGRAETIEYTVIPFKLVDEDSSLLCATLRPETVYGVTNIWVLRHAEYLHALDRRTTRRYILAQPAFERLKAQGTDLIEDGERLRGADLVRRQVLNPATGAKVPVLPAWFVQRDRGTGIVMSVPAHAPYDYAELEDLKGNVQFREDGKHVEPILLIEVPGRSALPAKDAIEKHWSKEQRAAAALSAPEQIERLKRAALDAATQEVYKEEFHKGKLREIYGELAGLPVAKGKEKVVELLRSGGNALDLREFSEEVVCRSGDRVEIRIVPEQWFIRYSDQALTASSKEWARGSMRIHPKQYHEEMPAVLDWFGDRACVRQGSWLGTEFPLKPGWIVEPISDSTLYPAYYLVSRYLNEGRLRPEHLTDGFFDHVFAVKDDDASATAGGAPAEVVQEARSDFMHWYPLDLNCGGKEHKTVHFPPFVMNHLALLDRKYWPLGIFVNWWMVAAGGQKISKSKGGLGPVMQAAEQFGADAIRLYYCHVGSPAVDIEWNLETAASYRRRIESLYDVLLSPVREPSATLSASENRLDRWLLGQMDERTIAYIAAMEMRDLREAANLAFYEVSIDLRRYSERGGHATPPREFVERWSMLVAPFAPHLAEEAGEHLDRIGFASLAALSAPVPPDQRVLLEEEYHDALVADVQAILARLKAKPAKITLFLAEAWKRTALRSLLDGAHLGEVIKASVVAARALVPGAERDAPDFVKKVAEEARSAGDALRRMSTLEEESALEAIAEDLSRRLGAPLEIVTGEDTARASVGGEKKAKAARPYRPGILVS